MGGDATWSLRISLYEWPFVFCFGFLFISLFLDPAQVYQLHQLKEQATFLWSLPVSGDVQFHFNIQYGRLEGSWESISQSYAWRARSKMHILSNSFPFSPACPTSFLKSLLLFFNMPLIFLKTWHIPKFTDSKFGNPGNILLKCSSFFWNHITT